MMYDDIPAAEFADDVAARRAWRAHYQTFLKAMGALRDDEEPVEKMEVWSTVDPWMWQGDSTVRRAEEMVPAARPARAEAGDRGLYIGRRVENVSQLERWAREHGITLDKHPHVTVLYSPTTPDRDVVEDIESTWRVTVTPREFSHIAPLGDKGAVVLHLRSRELRTRNAALCRAGGWQTHEGPYKPHLTLTYQGERINWRRVPMPDFSLVLGPELRGPLDGPDVFEKAGAVEPVSALVAKAVALRQELEARTPHIIEALRGGLRPGVVQKSAAEERQYAMGWASVVSDADGRVLRDRQGDVIPMRAIQKAARHFMRGERTAGIVHLKRQGADGRESAVPVGRVIESLIVTPVAKAVLGLPPETPHGWAVTMHVTHPAAWAAVKDGTFRAFSIGGRGDRTPVTLPAEHTTA